VGLANIGAREIRKRRTLGIVSAVAAGLLGFVLIGYEAPRWTRLLLFLPLWLAGLVGPCGTIRGRPACRRTTTCAGTGGDAHLLARMPAGGSRPRCPTFRWSARSPGSRRGGGR